MKTQLASLNHVTAAYFDAPVLRDVTLEFLSQEVVGVVGPNGAGKSTLLKCLLGELPPDEGTVVRARNLTIGYLPQESELDPAATAWEVMQEAVPALRAVETALAEVEEQLGNPKCTGSLNAWKKRWSARRSCCNDTKHCAVPVSPIRSRRPCARSDWMTPAMIER